MRLNNTCSNKINGVISGCFLIAVAILLQGCSKSVININVKAGSESYPMFGKVASRIFYYPVTISDSIKKVWESEVNGGLPASSVAAYGDFIFVNDLSGRVYCFDINTGKTAGQLKKKGAVYTTPVIDKLNVIYAYPMDDGNKSGLVIYDFSAGKFIAEIENIPGRALTDIIKSEDGVIFITANGIIYKYDFKGDKVFEQRTKTFTHSTPALKNDILVFGNDKGELTGFNIKNQKEIYRVKISGAMIAGVSISGETAFAGDFNGVVYAMDINSGTLLWKYNTGKRIEMTPAFDEKNVYVGNGGGVLYALDKFNGELTWETSTDGVLSASPMITDNIIIVPDLFEKVHFINKENGKLLKSMLFESRVKLTPVYYDSLLFLGRDDGIVEAYEFIK